MTSKHQPSANPSCSSGWTNNFQLKFLHSTLFFQSAAVVGRRNANFHLNKALHVVRHFMNRLLTIALLFCLFLQSCIDKSASLDKVIKEMADYKMFEYELTGLGADSSQQWARYKTLLAKSSESELLQLCENESPVVRSYAFLGLVEKNSSKIFEVMTKHISDTGEFDRTMGCFVDPCYVTDFYLEQVGYFPYDSSTAYKITFQQREYLDSLMLYGNEIKLRMTNYNKIRLRSRDYMLENLTHKDTYYNRLREIVLAGVIEALPALAKYKNPNDISVIKNVYETEGLIGEDFVFDAIINFPHPDLFETVEKEVTNDLRHDNYFDGSSFKYYKALIQYKSSRTRELLSQTISKSESDNQVRRTKSVKYLISKNPDKMFAGLLK